MACPTQIKFDVPEECRTFTKFQQLPPEIRQKIWESYLSTPGVHFLKLQTKNGSWSWSQRRDNTPMLVGETDETETEEEEVAKVLKDDRVPRESNLACLIPVGPCPRADVSHYRALRRQLATMSQTCAEACNVAQRLKNRSDTLKLDNGSIIALGGSSDVIYLDYFPPSLYESNANLETIPNCSDLDGIKRVAVRFSKSWLATKKSCRCESCRKSASSIHKGVYPAHLYQLLARHFPNLEEFFFIDYLIVRKSQCQQVYKKTPAGGPTKCTQRFQAGNRSYHEANNEEWIMNGEVSEITAWLRSSFVRYAAESPVCRHKDPEKVRFSILGCEWKISPPAERPGTLNPSEAKVKPASLLCRASKSCYSQSKRHKLWLQEARATSTQGSTDRVNWMTKADDAGFGFTFSLPPTCTAFTPSPSNRLAATRA